VRHRASLESAASKQTTTAFAHGLVVQVLFDPGGFPPDLQVRLLDTFLAALRGLPANG
jgi:hypothetical protein